MLEAMPLRDIHVISIAACIANALTVGLSYFLHVHCTRALTWAVS